MTDEAARSLEAHILALGKELRATRRDLERLRREAETFNKIMLAVRKTEGASAMVAHLLRALAVKIG